MFGTRSGDVAVGLRNVFSSVFGEDESVGFEAFEASPSAAQDSFAGAPFVEILDEWNVANSLGPLLVVSAGTGEDGNLFGFKVAAGWGDPTPDLFAGGSDR